MSPIRYPELIKNMIGKRKYYIENKRDFKTMPLQWSELGDVHKWVNLLCTSKG